MIAEIALFHIFAGLLAITAGAFALVAAKGERLHRRSGTVFVYAMIVMGFAGASMAAMKFHITFQKLNTVAGVFAAYLVVTALLAVRPRTPATIWIERGACLAALGFGIFAIAIGVDAMNRPKASWFPTVPALIFGTVALLAVLGDVRMMRAGGLRGRQRVARHLWRMCFAMFIATGSFFLGQAKVFPESIRILPLLAVPVVLVLLAMAYWWARVLLAKRPIHFAIEQPTQPAGTLRRWMGRPSSSAPSDSPASAIRPSTTRALS